MSGEIDPEARAAAAIVRALEPLADPSRRRVVEWMVDRYKSQPNYDAINLYALDQVNKLMEAVRYFLPRCPSCRGSGLLEANEDGFQPRCGVCSPFRDAGAA
jgi:hypothetical protein